MINIAQFYNSKVSNLNEWIHSHKDCVVNTGKDIEMTVLHRSNRELMFLSILEALHIREHKPSLNKKDEYIHRPLRIRIW